MAAKTKKDVFDAVDVFDTVDVFDEAADDKVFKPYVAPTKVALKLSDEIKKLILDELAKSLKDQISTIVSEVKPERVVETKVIQKEGPRVEKTVIREIDQKALDKALSERLDAFKKDDEKRWKNIAPIVVPNGIANMEGQGGKVLSTDGRITKWIAASSTQGSSDAYTPTNVVTKRSYDANDTSLDELADVLGSLIASLQGAGIIQ